jgi:hypothetical protein
MYIQCPRCKKYVKSEKIQGLTITNEKPNKHEKHEMSLEEEKRVSDQIDKEIAEANKTPAPSPEPAAAPNNAPAIPDPSNEKKV